MIVRFVNIVEIDDHHCLNSFFHNSRDPLGV